MPFLIAVDNTVVVVDDVVVVFVVVVVSVGSFKVET